MSDPEPIRPKEGASQPTMLHSEDAQGSNSQNNLQPVATSTLLQNPLVGMSNEDVIEDAGNFALANGLAEYVEDFKKGALMAKVYNVEQGYENIDRLAQHEKQILRMEELKRWDNPWKLYLLCGLCAGCAIVQGMDQTIINGAQVRPPSPAICPVVLIRS